MALCHSNHNLVFASRGLCLRGRGCLAPLPGALCLLGSPVAAQRGDKRSPVCRSRCWLYTQAFKKIFVWCETTSWSGEPQLGEQAEQNHLQTLWVHGQTHRRKQSNKEAQASSAFCGSAIFLFLLSSLKRTVWPESQHKCSTARQTWLMSIRIEQRFI